MTKESQYDYSGSDDSLSENHSSEQSVSKSEEKTSLPDSSNVQSIDDIPYVLRREAVKDNREVVSFYLQDNTQSLMTKAHRTLEDEFDSDTVYQLDTYEIILLNGMLNSQDEIDEAGLIEVAKSMGFGIR
jgi:hypothetical protein